MSFTGRLAIVGGGVGGLALAGFLARRASTLAVYEQARRFHRIGAGIQMSPNAVKVLRALGLETRVRQVAFAPRSWSNRVWNSGDDLHDLAFGDEARRASARPIC